MTRALVLQHGEFTPPGLLAEWLAARGIAAEVHDTDAGAPHPDPDGFAFVASLGWRHSPRDTHEPAVAAELALLREAVERDVPVLGLCFGGQALATVLGGAVAPLAAPELGWRTVQSAAPELVAPGPWLQWHFEGFTVPPGAEELARSPAGPQAFRAGPHLGVQFHPESTAEIVAEWARFDRDRVGDGHVGRLLDGGRRHGATAARAAFRLFDGFLRRQPAS